MFNTARIKLTAQYLLTIMIVSSIFSLIIYRSLAGEVDRFARMQRARAISILVSNRQISPVSLFPNEDIVSDTKHRIVLVLLMLNGGILFLAGGLGYLLAGRTLQPIKDMVDDQKRFISDSSHELRTPLTSLKSSIEVALRDKNLTFRETKLLLKENLEDINRLQSLSDNLLRLSSGKYFSGSEKTRLNLKHIISSSVKNVGKIAESKNITLISQVTKNIYITGNAGDLTELFTILLDNAIKYSKPKGEVNISVSKTSKQVTVMVNDKGIGISKEDIPHIFDRFYRSDSARTHNGTGGFGLGLSIAKKIVDDHSADIKVSSAPGKGSTFAVRFVS